MISAVTCSREVLQQDFVGVLRTTEARRNTIPPAHALTAKHLLAYLPRPQPQPLRYAPYSYKAAAKPSFASVMSTRPALFVHNANYANCSSAQEPRTLRATGPGGPAAPGPGRPDPCGSPSEPAREPAAPQRAARGRNMKRFSSRWQHRGSTGGGGGSGGGVVVPAQPSGTRTHKKRCKLLGDPHSLHVAATNQRQRYVAKDGKCNVTLGPIREKSRFLSDIFTTLVDLRYRWFLLVFSLCYVLTWVAFGAIYFLGAWLRDDLAHAQDRQWRACFVNVDGFLSALLLSLESQRTIGYGARMVSSQCPEGAVLLMVQSILGSIIDALMVGCMFVKISRPQQRAQTLIFSKHCVICQRDGKLCLLFRIGDLRESHMVDAKIRAKLIKSRQTKEGEFIPLEQSEINLGYDTGGDRLLLVEPQTIAHLITRSSPFWELSAQRLRRETFEIIVILEGIVEASGMTCQARTSYTEDEVLWGHRFESCISLEKGAFRVDYGAFDKTFEVQMPQLCEKDRKSTQEEEHEISE